MNDGSIPVVITSSDEVVWQGQAESLSAENSSGKFDVLPEHANFVTIINPNTPIVIRTVDKNALVFTYKDAVLAVKGGRVDVYVNI